MGRPPGRPSVYKSEEERNQARKQQIRDNVRAYRARKKEDAPLFKWQPVLTSSSQARTGRSKDKEPGIVEVRDVSDTEEVESVSTTTTVKSLNSNRRKSSATLITDFGCHHKTVTCPTPRDLTMGHLAVLTSGVLEDYLSYDAFRNDDHWPWVKVQRFSVSVTPHSTIAHCALFIGGLKGDQSLMRIANEEYHHAIRFVRFHSSDAQLKRVALALLIATVDLGNYELTSEILTNDGPRINAFRHHFDAGMRIMTIAGPQIFETEFGMQVFVGLMPQMILRTFAQRKALFVASAEWLAVLETAPKNSYLDGIWPIAVQIPALMQKTDILMCESNSMTKSAANVALTNLGARVAEVGTALDSWLHGYRHEHNILDGLELYWSSTALPRSTNNALSPSIDFATKTVASMMMTYWTYKLELAMLRDDIYTLEAIPGETLDNDPIATVVADAYGLAKLILRSATYWLESQNVSIHVCMYMLIFPYRVAWAWFGRRPQLYAEEISACRTIRARLLTGGFNTRLAEFVLDQLYKGPPDQV